MARFARSDQKATALPRRTAGTLSINVGWHVQVESPPPGAASLHLSTLGLGPKVVGDFEDYSSRECSGQLDAETCWRSIAGSGCVDWFDPEGFASDGGTQVGRAVKSSKQAS